MKRKYTVYVTTQNTYEVEVEAKDREEAISIASEKYDSNWPIESEITETEIIEEGEEIPENEEEIELLKQRKLEKEEKENKEWCIRNNNFLDKLEPNNNINTLINKQQE
jgi:hypothetical protein